MSQHAYSSAVATIEQHLALRTHRRALDRLLGRTAWSDTLLLWLLVRAVRANDSGAYWPRSSVDLSLTDSNIIHLFFHEPTTIVCNKISLLRLRGWILLQNESLMKMVLLLLLIRRVVVNGAGHNDGYHRVARSLSRQLRAVRETLPLTNQNGLAVQCFYRVARRRQLFEELLYIVHARYHISVPYYH
jgi:hypothetical protein